MPGNAYLLGNKTYRGANRGTTGEQKADKNRAIVVPMRI